MRYLYPKPFAHTSQGCCSDGMVKLSRMFSLLIVAVVTGLGACGDEAQPTDPYAGQAARTQSSSTLPATDSVVDIVDFQARLQGSYRRINYPYGTIQVSGNMMKIEPGEGLPEPAVLQSYQVASSCKGIHPSSEGPTDRNTQYVIFENGSCERLWRHGDTLSLAADDSWIHYLPNGESVVVDI